MDTAARISQPCRNHSEVETSLRCERCARAYCRTCLVRIRGQEVCAGCKRIVVRDTRRRRGARDRAAQDALVYSLIGLVPCLSVFLQPLALATGFQALAQYRRDPSLPNRWKAVTAVSVASVVLLAYMVWFLSLVWPR